MKTRKRILYVAHSYPTVGVGGVEVYTQSVAQALSAGHKVAVLYRTQMTGRPDYQVSLGRDGSVVLFEMNNCQRERHGFGRYADRRIDAGVGEILDRWLPDIVHIQHLEGLSTGIVREARSRSVPVVITLHDYGAVCVRGQLIDRWDRVCPGPAADRCVRCVGEQLVSSKKLPVPRNALTIAVGAWLARFLPGAEDKVEARLEHMRTVIGGADRVMAPSSFLAKRMGQFGFEGVTFVPAAPRAVTVSHHMEMPRHLRVGYVGQLIQSKGVHVLCQALMSLPASFELALYGPAGANTSGYEERLKALLGTRRAASLRGSFSPAQIGEILAGLDVLVIPSLWEENAPLVVQEAFAAGVPVIASATGGLRDLIDDGVTGLLFPPGDVLALRRLLLRLSRDRVLLSRLSNVSPRSFKSHLDELEAIYDDVISSKKSSAPVTAVPVMASSL